MDIKKLAQESIAAKNLRTPYSHFRVGAHFLQRMAGYTGDAISKSRIYTDKLCGEDRFV